ncbi:cryptochrome DASH [Salvelinus alpinus]|uniref:cryptochrome DASH isoform X1 n=1 Tax=Salvelinus alpinus TaxID=8036 RepID=UPI0039FCF9A8
MSTSRTVICLLRNDLRLHDNEVFHWAQRNAEHIVPLYCFDPGHYLGTANYNLPRTGPFRLRFLLDSIQDLRTSLIQRGSTLVVRRGRPEEVVGDLIKQLGSVSAVAFHEEVVPEDQQVERGVRDICSQMKVKVHTCWGSTLYHRDDLPFNHLSRLPDVYTQFRKAVETQGRVRPVLPTVDQLKPLPPGSGLDEGPIPSPEDLEQTDTVRDPRSAFPCSGGETQALARLQHYFWDTDAVATYKETRNGLIGLDYSTKFSPWLAIGCISPRYIYQQIKKYESERTANQSTYWVVFELLWRDYFKFVGAKYGDRLFDIKGLQDKSIPWKKDMNLFNAWKEGRTGVPFVDANMRELALTGFMSNRGRQNVASFLTKDLGLDWRMGAEWFHYLLVDHDVSSNYGNWLYSAGIGNDPRENRKFNMIKQGLDYDNNGDYVRHWVPELKGIRGGEVHTPWTLSSASLSHALVSLNDTYPSPVVMAPEWSRHTNKKPTGAGPSARGKTGPSHTPKQHKDRGIDFYFSKSKNF